MSRELRDEFCCSHRRAASESSSDAQMASGKFAKPGSKAAYGPDQSFDVDHILLEFSLDVPKKTVHGKCTTTLRALIDGANHIAFDALKMKVLGVTLSDGSKLNYSYKKDQISVRFPGKYKEGEIVSVVIEYRLVNPIAGVYFIAPDKDYPKKPVQVWSHGEAEESRYWIPCFDAPHDKATTEVVVTVPRDFFALSNGALIDVREDRAKKTKTYHWKQAIPHSCYLITMVAGKFSEIKTEWDGIPITYYCEPGREDEIQRAFGKTPKMVQFFSEKIGVRYPYEKYAQIAVADFVMGGMEHTTATTQTDRVLMDAKAFPEFTADWLVSHELAHQWFGDLLTCKEWGHAWLNESFATYFEALFTEHDLGKDEFDYEMHEKLQQYLDEDRKVYRRSIVTNVYKKPEDLFDRHLYEKGSVVLHTLRNYLGEELWWKGIGHYVNKHQGQAVETIDLINSIQEATGKNMRKFFDQWIFAAGHPDFTVYYWWDEKTKNANVRVTQKTDGKNSFSSVPIELEFQTAGGRKEYKVTLEDKKHEFKYKFSSEPRDFRFDPGFKVLKTAEIHKPYKMWAYQLQNDRHAVGRALAAQEIAKIQNAQSVSLLSRAFAKEKFWGTAKEIALALGKIHLKEAKEFLLRSANAKHPKTRRGVVEALGEFNDPSVAAQLKRIFLGDKSYFVRAEALRSLSRFRQPDLMQWVKKALNTASWNDTIRAQGVSSLAQVPTSETVALLKKYVAYGNHPSSRGAALGGLGRLLQHQPELLKEVYKLTEDPFTRIKHAAVTTLGNSKLPQAVPILEKFAKNKDLPYRSTVLADDALLKINPQNSN